MRMTPNASRTLAGLAVLVAALSSTLFAQWPNHPDPGVPRTKTGEPDLDAPAPRMPDGKPDLSGLWQGANAVAGRAKRAGLIFLSLIGDGRPAACSERL